MYAHLRIQIIIFLQQLTNNIHIDKVNCSAYTLLHCIISYSYVFWYLTINSRKYHAHN